jgi:hypothetical protein
MKTANNLLSLFIILTFISCGVFSKKEKRILFNSKSEKGLLIGSLTIINEPSDYDSFLLIASPIMSHSSSFMFDLRLNEYLLEPDYKKENRFIYFFAIEELPGEHYFNNYHKEKNLKEPKSFSVKNKFGIRFKIEKGKINYLGNIILYPNRNENGYFFEIINDFERDLPKIMVQYPNVEWNNEIKNAINKGEKKIEFGI